MFCIECGYDIPDQAKFCNNCGAKVPDPVAQDNKRTSENESVKQTEAGIRKEKKSHGSKSNPLVWGSDHKDVAGLTPVRRHDVPPTNRIKTDASTINVKDSAQVRGVLLKSKTAKSAHTVPLLFGILALIFVFGGFAADESGLGIISLIVAILLFIIAVSVKRNSRKPFRLGFDWKTNTIWAGFEGKKVSWIGNANCITRLYLDEHVSTSIRYQNVGNSSFRTKVPVRHTTRTWALMVEKTDNSKIPLVELYSKKDAETVLSAATGLLNKQ
jgi:hypothetical protein